MIGIRQQREGQIKFRNKLLMRSLSIRTDADDFDVALLCFGMRVAEPARFFRSARRIVFRIEKQHDFFALEIRELHRLAARIGQAEGGRFIADLKSCCGHNFFTD